MGFWDFLDVTKNYLWHHFSIKTSEFRLNLLAKSVAKSGQWTNIFGQWYGFSRKNLKNGQISGQMAKLWPNIF